ncbi:hypothetical protein OSB04_016374 [Centaurea solstitialis]|uniref:Tf2-1-like SH3-like domain-containing protein n=1 Tax=Centaurea solstitialis TaxID=347529 RepID=A0AA38T0T8_9ASTR|nr:hypothetical protein OSB04_016374 [Centaurea solstitialis]
MPFPSRGWEEITKEFVEGLPCLWGLKRLMLWWDQLTKYAPFRSQVSIEINFEVGGKAILKLQTYRQKPAEANKNQKLTTRFYGPSDREMQVEKVAYRLKLPESAGIHPLFHVSQLSKAITSSLSSTIIPNHRVCINSIVIP